MNDMPKAHILVSEMTPMEGFCLAKILADGPQDIEAVDAFALTSHQQISQDLVEEWIACDSPALSSETQFSDIERRDRYVFPRACEESDHKAWSEHCHLGISQATACRARSRLY
jgi:hypothetical protein